MRRLDASLLAGLRVHAIAAGELQRDLVVIARAADGTARVGFVETTRRPPAVDGFGAAFWDDGTLRHLGCYDGGACVASLDLHAPSEHGVFRQGRTLRTGEVYARGTIETLSPWSDQDAARPPDRSFEDWVVEHVAAVARAADRTSRR